MIQNYEIYELKAKIDTLNALISDISSENEQLTEALDRYKELIEAIFNRYPDLEYMINKHLMDLSTL